MKKTLLGLSMVLALTGCARDANQSLEVWNNFEKSSVSTQLGNNQALVVFYRQDDVAGQAVNIYVDGNYQVSLLPNTFSPVAVCADKHLFSTSFSAANSFGNRTQGVNYTLSVGEVNYVKVSQVNGKLTFERVESAVGSAAVSKLPKENQTLSRVPAPTNCGTAVMAVENLEAGMTAPIVAVGYGKAEPIVTTCDAYQGTQRNQCNQLNRRVEIAVYGN
ncbi:hypothetical protein EDC44_12919 [Cricetibacter osteomyelitidis]|uniref:Lipoprotein n=1 Tax=Cricetibacter osteomyelitidis TaxID=1521931 RepID=A0A4R2TB74_9PAST|nr:lipoprotein [Cricetibacter osteomyelitidis]TCP92042.1 hypothetical protein EDC44_12919 [Cricetibacter osteomyelitidis]